MTTCLIFSLFRMPSRRPLVIPATFNNFVPLIMWLSANHQRVSSPVFVLHTLASSHTNSLCLDLEAQATLVLPQRRSHPRLHAWRGNLSRRVESLGRRAISPGVWHRLSYCWQGQDVVLSHRARNLMAGRLGGGQSVLVPILRVWIGSRGILRGTRLQQRRLLVLLLLVVPHAAGGHCLRCRGLPVRDMRIVHVLGAGVHVGVGILVVRVRRTSGRRRGLVGRL